MNKYLLSTGSCILFLLCLAGLGVSAQSGVKAQETQHQTTPRKPAEIITKPAKPEPAYVAPVVPKPSVPVQQSEKVVSQPRPALQPATASPAYPASYRVLTWKPPVETSVTETEKIKSLYFE